LIFLDPPFGQGMLEKILPYCAKLLSAHGLLYVEAEFNLLNARQIHAAKSGATVIQNTPQNTTKMP